VASRKANISGRENRDCHRSRCLPYAVSAIAARDRLDFPPTVSLQLPLDIARCSGRLPCGRIHSWHMTCGKHARFQDSGEGIDLAEVLEGRRFPQEKTSVQRGDTCHEGCRGMDTSAV
jgi:hypothetical protein